MHITGLDHVYLSVSSFERAERFYDAVMHTLGYRKGDKRIAGERHAHYVHPTMQITIRPARAGAPPHDPYAPGLHHLCLQVRNRADVDDAHARLTALGVNATEPHLYPEYNPEYYATFFEDPDGLRLEVVARTGYRRELARRWHELDRFLNPLAARTEAIPPARTAVELRRATPADRDVVRALVREYHLEDAVPHDESELDAILAPLLEDANVGVIWILSEASSAIGYAAVCFGYSIEFGGRDAFIDELYVAADARGRGIARGALQRILDELKRLGINAVHLEAAPDNAPAARLYARAGFTRRTAYQLLTRRL